MDESYEQNHTNNSLIAVVLSLAVGGIVLVGLILGCIWLFQQLFGEDKSALFFDNSSYVLACKRPYLADVDRLCGYGNAAATGDFITSIRFDTFTTTGYSTSCDRLGKDTSVPICRWIDDNGGAWDVFPGNTSKGLLR